MWEGFGLLARNRGEHIRLLGGGSNKEDKAEDLEDGGKLVE